MSDDQKQDGDGPDNENDEQDKSDDVSSPKEANVAGKHVNTSSLDVNTGSFKLNTIDLLVNTASSYDQDSPKDMFTMRASHTLEATHVEFFSDEDELRNIEAIRLFLAYASFYGFLLVYQMDVKSAFLYGTIKEEVYVTQPPGFKDPDYPNKVYKVVKALYGLHQAPRAWYETLANYLMGNGFKRGKIDQTLFIKKQKGDILLVQVYVDDIIFGSTNKELCTGFEKLMKDKFQMSSMGELTFFLGLQVQQKEDGIFISQDKYVAEILKKFNYTDVKSASTLVDLEKPLVKDGDADDVDVHLYRSMIGSLMYLTASRPDIMLISWQCKKQTVVCHLSTTKAESCGLAGYTIDKYSRIQNSMLDYKARLLKPDVECFTSEELDTYVNIQSMDGRICNIKSVLSFGDEVVHKELGDRMERAATTAYSLEAEQDSEIEVSTGNLNLNAASLRIWNGKKKSRTTRLQRLRKVGESSRVESSKDKESLGDHEDASKQGRSIEDHLIRDSRMFSLFDDTHGESRDFEENQKFVLIMKMRKSKILLFLWILRKLKAKRKQKKVLKDDKETDEHEKVEVDDEAELKKHLVIVKNDDIAIDVDIDKKILADSLEVGQSKAW
ncbi:putative ribonuclease H-like domain-containing protein [Tanacetum coccineum]